MPRGIYDHYKIRGRPSGCILLKEIRICSYKQCDNTFEIDISSRRKYCSRKCANRESGKNRPKEFYKNRVSLKGKKRPPFSNEWKKNMSKAAKGKRSGSKNSNWKGGVTEEHQLIRCSDVYKTGAEVFLNGIILLANIVINVMAGGWRPITLNLLLIIQKIGLMLIMG